MAATEIAIMPAEEPTKMLTMAPIISTMAPTNRNFPMPDRSRFITLARLAITKNTPAVPPKAVMMSWAPLLKPRMLEIRRDSIRPMKNVKPSSTATPADEFFVFSIAYMKPKAPPMKMMNPNPPRSDWTRPVATPSQAPNTVGSKLNAKSQ